MNSWGKVFLVVFIFFATSIVTVAALGLLSYFNPEIMNARSSLIIVQTICSIAQSALAGVVASMIIFRRPLPPFTERQTTIGAFILTFIFIGICQPLVTWASYVNYLIINNLGLDWAIEMQNQNNNLVARLLAFDTPFDWAVSIFVIAIVPAFCEELFFRGVLQRTIVKASKNVAFAIVVSAAFFSIMHMDLLAFVPRIILGVVLGLIFHLSGSLWLSIIAHCINNLAVVIMLGINRNETPIAEQLSKTAENPGPVLPIASLLLCIYVVMRFVAWRKVANDSNNQ